MARSITKLSHLCIFLVYSKSSYFDQFWEIFSFWINPFWRYVVFFFRKNASKNWRFWRPTHLAPRGALALKPYLRTLNAELATLEGITPKLQVINQAEMDQVRLGWESGCVWGKSPDLGGRVRKLHSCSCCCLVFFFLLGVVVVGGWEWVGFTSFISGWLGQTFSCWWLVTSCCL